MTFVTYNNDESHLPGAANHLIIKKETESLSVSRKIDNQDSMKVPVAPDSAGTHKRGEAGDTPG
jgi:hypothetical protein